MNEKTKARNRFKVFLVLAILLVSEACGAPADSLVGALFGTAYISSFGSKEVDFYIGQTFYDANPTSFDYLGKFDTTFGSDITLFRQDFFSWFVGTERLARSGTGVLDGVTLQWNIPVNALYSGARFDSDKENLLSPYVFAIGGLYSMSDLLGSDALICNGVSSKPTTYTGSTYNINGTTLGLEFGAGFTPFQFKDIDISVEGNYRFAKFQTVSYSPSSSSLPVIPKGLPTSIDYSGWSVAINVSFDPPAKKKRDPTAAREKLLAGNIPYTKKSFMNAVENCDSYVVKLFLESGLKTRPEELSSISKDRKVCDEVKKVISSFAPKGD